MPQTKPAEAPTDVELVRQTLMRELETINAYEVYSRQAADPLVKQFLAHLASEEKEHVSEATALMRRLDREQDEIFESESGEEHFATGAHTHERPSKAGAESAPGPVPSFTVGSLRRQP